MLRLIQAPNLALATMWVEALAEHGIAATVLRQYLSSAAGELPPDQCLPEIWCNDPTQEMRARDVLDSLQNLPQRCWWCPCGELVEGGFELCWNCGTPMPPGVR